MEYFPSWTRSVHSFLWLHVLSPEDLDDLTLDSYLGQAGSGFATEQHNLSGLWEWEEAAFRECFSDCRSVLVAGAGGGREMIALAKMGLEVIGFDPSEDLTKVCLDNARNAGVTVRIVRTQPGEIPCGDEQYEALLIGRGVYHHIARRARRIDFLKACRGRIRSGAPMVLADFLTRGQKRPLTAFALSKAVEPGDSVTASFFHCFTREEIVSELEEAGLELLDYRVTPFPGGGNLAHALGRSKSSASRR